MFRKILFVFAATLLIGCADDDYRIVSESMKPTYKVGDVVTADPHAYDAKAPQRWDVVLFVSPLKDSGIWNQRVVGLPGETIEIREGNIVINGRTELPPSHLSYLKYLPDSVNAAIHFPYRLQVNNYFMLGDNSSDAIDSRHHGPVSRDRIRGKIVGPSSLRPIYKKLREEDSESK